MTPDALERMESSPEEIGELLGRYATALGDARVRAQSVDGRYVDACGSDSVPAIKITQQPSRWGRCSVSSAESQPRCHLS